MTDIDLSKLVKSRHIPELGYIPSTIWPLNLIFSSGHGIPRRQIVEIYSPEGVGKSTFLYNLLDVAANHFKYPTVLANQETPIDDRRLARFNLYPGSNLLLEHEESIEHLFVRFDEIISGVRKTNATVPIIFGLDSVNGSAPIIHTDKRDLLKNPRQGGAGKSWSDMLRQWLSKYYYDDVTLLLTNHLMDSMKPYGPPTTTPGGRFIKFIASFRISMRRKAKIEGPTGVIGHEVIFKCDKNKFAPPFQEVRVPLLYGTEDPNSFVGFWDDLACLWFLQDHGLLKKGGSWTKLDIVDPVGEVREIKFQGETGWLSVFPTIRNEVYEMMRQVVLTSSARMNPNP